VLIKIQNDLFDDDTRPVFCNSSNSQASLKELNMTKEKTNNKCQQLTADRVTETAQPINNYAECSMMSLFFRHWAA
jgi:transcription elongation factor Elf1